MGSGEIIDCIQEFFPIVRGDHFTQVMTQDAPQRMDRGDLADLLVEYTYLSRLRVQELFAQTNVEL